METELETFTQAFIEALYFADTGEEGQPDTGATLSDEARADIEADCRSWWRRLGCYVVSDVCADVGTEGPIVQAGHDFYFTRQGHGAGFWDGDWPEVYGDKLTEAAKCYGEFWIDTNEQGEIVIC